MAHALYECIAAAVAKAADLPGATFHCLPFDCGHKVGVSCVLPNNGGRTALRRSTTNFFAKPSEAISELGNAFHLWGTGTKPFSILCVKCGGAAIENLDGDPLCHAHASQWARGEAADYLEPCPIEAHRAQRAELGLCAKE